MSPDIERELHDYLRAQKEADAIGTQKRLADWAIKHDADDKIRHTELLAEVRNVASELRGDFRGLSLRVGALEKSDEKLEDRLDKSGSWDREALQAQAHIAREETKRVREGSWLVQNWPSVVSAAVAVIAIALTLAGKK